jgi:hypothetical protein
MDVVVLTQKRRRRRGATRSRPFEAAQASAAYGRVEARLPLGPAGAARSPSRMPSWRWAARDAGSPAAAQRGAVLGWLLVSACGHCASVSRARCEGRRRVHLTPVAGRSLASLHQHRQRLASARTSRHTTLRLHRRRLNAQHPSRRPQTRAAMPLFGKKVHRVCSLLRFHH